MRNIALLCVALTACMRPYVSGRFADHPIVTRSDDTRTIAEPSEQPYYGHFDSVDAVVFRPIFDGLDRRARPPAGDTNALDELPDSTWFTNRIGAHDMSVDEVVKGPDVDGPPQLPFVVSHAKVGGGNPGFIAKDARGKKYLFKFDTPENPGQQTATDAIAGRILWACGYHTPSDYLVYFQRNQLSISTEVLAKKTLDEKRLDKMLEDATKMPDGRIRATASQILDGVPKGGWPQVGLRDDDPNDHVRHEDRRVLRGLFVISAWLNHTDMKDDNALDMFLADKGGPKDRGHLEHYLVDFGEAFGGHQSEHQVKEIGFEYAWDWPEQGKALVSFGLWHRRWEDQRATKWPQVGYFSSNDFDPARWKVLYRYLPYELADRADKYWGAKLVMRFTRPQIEAIVKMGELGDPEAERYVVDALLARQAAIGAAFLDDVTPLDQITIQDGKLCGTDLARHYGVASDGELVVDGVATPIAADGHVCAAMPADPGYRIAHVSIRRAAHTTPALEVHYVGGAAPHVVGLVR